MIGRVRGKSEAEMKVDLLVGPDLVRASNVNDMNRPSALRIFAAVLHKSVQFARDLPIEQKAWLTGQIASRSLSGPEK